MTVRKRWKAPTPAISEQPPAPEPAALPRFQFPKDSIDPRTIVVEEVETAQECATLIDQIDKLRILLANDIREAKFRAWKLKKFASPEWYRTANELHELTKQLRNQLQDRRGELRRAEKRAKSEGDNEADERRFIEAANRLLPRDYYLAIWSEANGEASTCPLPPVADDRPLTIEPNAPGSADTLPLPDFGEYYVSDRSPDAIAAAKAKWTSICLLRVKVNNLSGEAKNIRKAMETAPDSKALRKLSDRQAKLHEQMTLLQRELAMRNAEFRACGVLRLTLLERAFFIEAEECLAPASFRAIKDQAVARIRRQLAGRNHQDAAGTAERDV